MKLTPRQKRWLRKNPAPPLTPRGFVYANRYGKTELVKADELSKAARASMGAFDNLPASERAEVRNLSTNIAVTGEEQRKAQINQGLATFGIKLAR